MDPLSAVGLAGNIVQLIEFGGEVINRLNEFSSHGGNIPQRFREDKLGLPLLLISIERLQENLDSGRPIDPRVETTLLPIIQEVRKLVERLSKILDDTLPVPGDSQWKNFSKALSSFWQEKKIRDIRASIDRYQGHLVLHQATSPSRRGDEELERHRASITQAISRTGSTNSLYPTTETTLQSADKTRDKATSYSPVFTRASTASSQGSPTETIFDSGWSMRTVSTARTGATGITIPIPNALEPKAPHIEPAAIEGLHEAPLIPAPAIDRPQRTIKAKMTYSVEGSKPRSVTSNLEFGRTDDSQGTVTSIIWTGVSDHLWIYHSISQSESQYPHTHHPASDGPTGRTTHIVSFMGRQVLIEQEQSAEWSEGGKPPEPGRRRLLERKHPPDQDPILTETIDYWFESRQDLDLFRTLVFGKRLLACVPVISISFSKIECETENLSLWESSGVRTVVYYASASSDEHVELEVASSDALKDWTKSDKRLTLEVKCMADSPYQRTNSVSSTTSVWSTSPGSRDRDYKGLKVKFQSDEDRDLFASKIRY